MGIFNKIFKKQNIIENASSMFNGEEKKLILRSIPPIVGNESDLKFNSDGVLSFATAVLCFKFDTDEKLQGAKFKSEYFEFIKDIKNRDDFQLIYKFLMDYYHGIPTLDKALVNLTYAYLATVWGIKKVIPDPVFHLGFSMFLTETRNNLDKYFSNFVSELVEIK